MEDWWFNFMDDPHDDITNYDNWLKWLEKN